MLEDIIRTGTAALALSAAAMAAHAAEDLFPQFEQSAGALVANQVPGADNAKLAFTNPAVARGAAQMYGASPQMSLESFDPRGCRFAIKVQDGARSLPPALLTGACQPVARVPVAARDLRPGEVIAAADLRESEEPLNRINQSVLRDASAIIGQTPRQFVAAGRTLLNTAVKAKAIVEKGQAVTLRFRTGTLELTAMGQAQSSAAMGEPVLVLNVRSRKTVEAVVAGPGLADLNTNQSTTIAAVNSVK
jgi:flagellar basal body P-ring formation protein FlgA